MAPVNIRTMWLINEKVEILGKDIWLLPMAVLLYI
jgi:hypothetical protein